MFQFLGDLLTYLILVGLGIGLIFQYKKKKKDLFLILGVLMILINSVLAFNSYQSYQERELNKRAESKERVEKNLKELEKGAYGGSELTEDSTFTYLNHLKILAPAGFKVAELNVEGSGFMISKTIDSGIFMVLTVAVENTKNKTFESLVEGAFKTYGNESISYSFSDSDLNCEFENCKVTNYVGITNGVTTSKGFMVHTLNQKVFYTLMFANNSLDPKLTQELQQQIFNSIEFKNRL